jgi:hypothetical protein
MTYSLEQLKALESAATPGPWEHRIDDSWDHPDRVIESVDQSQPKDDYEKRARWTVVRDEAIDGHVGQARQSSDTADYEFIAAARTAVPELIAAIEARDQEIVTLREVLAGKHEALSFNLSAAKEDIERLKKETIAQLESEIQHLRDERAVATKTICRLSDEVRRLEGNR